MSKVSRSVYQKVVEENKRLMSDIKTLVEGDIAEKVLLTVKWKRKFEREREMNDFIQSAVRNYIQNNPKDKAVIATNKIIESSNLNTEGK